MVSDLQRETPEPRPGLSDDAARRASASSGSKIQHQAGGLYCRRAGVTRRLVRAVGVSEPRGVHLQWSSSSFQQLLENT